MPTKQYIKKLNGYYIKDEDARISITKRVIHEATVAAMIADEALQSGDRVRTAGYYSSNDGGEGEYAIVENGSAANGGTVIELTNGFRAELIFGNEINVKQFGAKGDGVAEDSTSIQNAIDSIRALNLSSTSGYIALTIPEGTYKISETIELSPMVRIKTTGSVTFDSYVEGSCLHILPKATDAEQWYHYNGRYITSDDGIFIVNKLNDKGATVALEVSTSTSVGAYKGFMHAAIEQITFKDFNTGLLIHATNVYCVNFEGLKFLNTNYNVVWGDQSGALNNAGERITFRNCQFGSQTTLVMIYLNSTIGDLNFLDCSFDYGNCVFYEGAAKKGYSNVNCSACHFEGVSYDMQDVTNQIFGIILGNFVYSNFTFNQCNIGIAHRRKMFAYFNDSVVEYSKYNLKLVDCVFGSPDIENSYDKIYIIDDNVHATIRSCVTQLAQNIFPNIASNAIPNPFFDTAESGSVDVSTNSTIAAFKVNYNPGFDQGAIETSDVTGKNRLKLRASSQNPAIQLVSDKFAINPGQKLNISTLTKNFYGWQAVITYYDKEGNQIVQTTRSPYFASRPSKSDTVINNYTVVDYAPYRAASADVRINYNNSGQEDTVLVGDYCCIDGMFCYLG